MRYIMVLLLGSLVLAFTMMCKLADNDNSSTIIPVQFTSRPTYQGKCTTTVIYNPVGWLNYKLVAKCVNYFAEKESAYFTQPIATIFDEKKVPTWIIKADRAELLQDKMLYLYGHVKINSLTDTSHLRCIITSNVIINLITQDVYTDNAVTLHGTSFYTTGMKMHCNLRNKTVELSKKVKTYYEL